MIYMIKPNQNRAQRGQENIYTWGVGISVDVTDGDAPEVSSAKCIFSRTNQLML